MTSFISVDWGTSAFRAALVRLDGHILDRIETSDGILSVPDRNFQSILAARVGALLKATDASDDREFVPILMSGMVGSRQGWLEAPYVKTPAGVLDLVDGIVSIDGSQLGRIMLVPGVETTTADGVPDVMRGEETQIFGALDRLATDSAKFVLPGTHAKWVEVSDGRLVKFATYMTGEVFAALSSHTILGRLMGLDAPFDSEGFAVGVDAGGVAGHPGALLHRIFAARTLGLTADWDGGRLSSYLSGLLIGAEIRAAAPDNVSPGPIYVIGSELLTRRYTSAAERFGVEMIGMAPDQAVAGHVCLMRHIGR